MPRAFIRYISRAQAEAIRARLKAEGYDRVVGSGRGTWWTRHKKGDETIFVEKLIGSEKFWAWGYNPTTDAYIVME